MATPCPRSAAECAGEPWFGAWDPKRAADCAVVSASSPAFNLADSPCESGFSNVATGATCCVCPEYTRGAVSFAQCVQEAAARPSGSNAVVIAVIAVSGAVLLAVFAFVAVLVVHERKKKKSRDK